MKRLLILLGIAAACAQDEWDLYHAPGADVAVLTDYVKPLLPPGVELRTLSLPSGCDDETSAHRQARAIADGVSVLPCLALRDAEGAYAVLPLQGLSKERILEAQKSAADPQRTQEALRRSELAVLFELRCVWELNPADAAKRELVITRYRELMQRPETPEDMRQFIALRCIYPALMQQYAEGYLGAHTPATEAKLLEAIHALEEARDINPSSYWGRVAYDEREKLRAARLKSRQYE